MASPFSIDDILNMRGRQPANSSEPPLQQISAVRTQASTRPSPAREMGRGRKRRRECNSSGNCETPPSSDSEEEKTPSPRSSPERDNAERGKSKRSRTAYSTAQLRSLECAFRLCPYPDCQARQVVAKATGITEGKIQIWFQNRRARFRKREKPFEQPMPRYRPILPRPSPAALAHFFPPPLYHPASSYHHQHHYHAAFPHPHPHPPPPPFSFNYQRPLKFTGAQSRSRPQN